MRLSRDANQVAGVALAVFLTLALAIALWWGFLRDGNSAAAQGSRVTLDFSTVPDGAPPAVFDAGQPVTVSRSPTDTGANFFVRGGRLTYEPTARGPAAAYLSTADLGAPVQSIGASWFSGPVRIARHHSAGCLSRHPRRLSDAPSTVPHPLRRYRDELEPQRPEGRAQSTRADRSRDLQSPPRRR